MFEVDLVNGLTLTEVREDLTVEDVIENTGSAFKVNNLKLILLFNNENEVIN